MTTTLNEYQLRRTGTRFGAEINGIDLRVPVSEGIRESLVRDFREHKVLVFRGQHLSPDQQVDAVRIFDEPFDHPTAVRHSENPLVYPYDVKTTGKASTWHIGGLWRNPPFSIESLVFEEVSELGGNTLWADLQAAYDDLSEPYKELLEGVSAVYDSDSRHYAQGAEKGKIETTIEHPLVRLDRNGRKGLFISSSALGLTGLPESEGRSVLAFLLAHASSPQYTIRFGWSAGDFVLWNNLATWHYAIDDYGTGPRRYRKVLAAEAS